MNSSKLSTLLAQDIEDPTEFPKKASSLRDLDSAVRCPICYDYFNGPVSLLCGHCFCSLCIRNVISASKAQCPVCKQSMSESQLRPNPGIEDVVTAWRSARPCILSLAKQEPEDKVEVEAGAAAEPATKKRKLEHPSFAAGSSRTSSSESSKSANDVDIITSSTVPEEDTSVPQLDRMVECPVCTRRMKYKELNRHMDNNCATVSSHKPLSKMSTPNSEKAKNAWSFMRPKSKGKEKEKSSDEDRLPKVSYDTLKDRQLKEKLTDLGLSTVGDRAAWIARHKQWTMLWNANLDRSKLNRQKETDLIKELKKWEEERKNKNKKTTVDESHLKTHNDEFKRLVAAARPKGSANARTSTDVVEVRSSPPPTSSTVPSNSDQDIIVVDSDDEGVDVS
ncbi:hypothetical protein K438DRAFT_1830497 [Mycena galopus ATCC 62051]|nr:hypothetical protein K438DRAFT_1830497 [Mycena galopus ATCC 62051]